MGRYRPRRRPRPPRVHHLFGVIPSAADLPRLAEAVLDAWGAETRVSAWGSLGITGGNWADLDADPVGSGVQPFTGVLYGGDDVALTDTKLLAAALRELDVPHRLELCDDDLEDLVAYEHAWREEWLTR